MAKLKGKTAVVTGASKGLERLLRNCWDAAARTWW